MNSSKLSPGTELKYLTQWQIKRNKPHSVDVSNITIRVYNYPSIQNLNIRWQWPYGPKHFRENIPLTDKLHVFFITTNQGTFIYTFWKSYGLSPVYLTVNIFFQSFLTNCTAKRFLFITYDYIMMLNTCKTYCFTLIYCFADLSPVRFLS